MNNRRKQLVVDGNFQYRFIMIGILVSFSLINVTILFGFFITEQGFFDASPNVVYSVAVALIEICALIIVFILSLRSSHRMAGPLFQVKKILQKIGEGDLATRTQFRQQDYFHDLGIQLNQTTEQLCQRITIIKETALELDSHLQDNSIATDMVQRMQQQLNEFKTERRSTGIMAEDCDLSAVEVGTETADCHQ